MADQHYLRTKYIPFRPDAIPISQTNTATYQVSQPVITGQVVGHVYQNVCIGGGMMTQKIPVTSQSNQVLVSNVHVIQSVYTPNLSESFVSPVNLIGSHIAPTKIAQVPIQTQWSKW